MSDRPSWVAVVSLVVALAGFGFTFYQWWNGERENNITAAIEFSLRNIQDGNIAKLRSDFASMVSDPAPPSDANVQRNLSAQAYVFYLNYVASLLNKGRIDERYASRTMLCQIYNVFENSYLNKILKNPAYANFLPSSNQSGDISDFHRSHPGFECR